MKKIYTIEITGSHLPNIWYADKIGEQFEACLKTLTFSTNVIVFQVRPNKHVYLIDCKVISERNVVVEVYQKES